MGREEGGGRWTPRNTFATVFLTFKEFNTDLLFPDGLRAVPLMNGQLEVQIQ